MFTFFYVKNPRKNDVITCSAPMKVIFRSSVHLPEPPELIYKSRYRSSQQGFLHWKDVKKNLFKIL